MTMLTIKEYFPAGAQTTQEIEIFDVVKTERADVWLGEAIIPPGKITKKIVIYRQKLANGKYEYRTISAKCPHQGADISADELRPDGNVYCSLHRRPICIFSEYNYAYLVEKRERKFFIVKNSHQTA